jgi:hypothetical protein
MWSLVCGGWYVEIAAIPTRAFDSESGPELLCAFVALWKARRATTRLFETASN